MPGEEGFISALTAPVVNLAIAAVVIALIAVVLMALLFLISNRQSSITLARAMDGNNQTLKALVAQGNQLVTQGHQLENMVHVMEREQIIQKEQNSLIAAAKTAIEQHDEKSAGYVREIEDNADARQKALAEHIKTTSAQSMTDLIGATAGIVDKSTKAIVETLLQGLGGIRISIETVQAEYRQKMEAIGEQVAETQHKFIQAIQDARGADSEEKSVVSMGDHGAVGGLVSVGAASGSTGDSGTGGNDGGSGTAGGTIA